MSNILMEMEGPNHPCLLQPHGLHMGFVRAAGHMQLDCVVSTARTTEVAQCGVANTMLV